MGKFCTKCGRPLQEGEICSCQMTTGNQGAGQQVPPQMGGQQTPPQMGNQQMGGQQTPPPQMGGQQTPPQMGNQQMGGQQIPPQMGGQQTPPPQMGNQQMGGQQIPPQMGNQQMGGQQIPPQMGGQQAPPQHQAVAGFFSKFFTCFLNLIRKPVTTGRTMILEADITTALVLILIQGIFSGLFAMAAGKRCASYIMALTGILDGYSSGSGAAVAGMLTIPYGRIFIVTVLISVVLSCILALLLMLGHLILKCTVSYPQMLSIVAVRSAVLVPSILVSIILFELQSSIGIFLFIAVNIWGFAAMILTMASFIPEEKKDMFVLMVSVVLLIFILVTVFTLSKTWTLYLPDVIRTALDSAKQYIGNPGELLEELMGNMF